MAATLYDYPIYLYSYIRLNPDYKTVLNYATQTMTATIVNAKADYLIKNMRRRLFQDRDNGLEGVEFTVVGRSD